MIHYPPLDGSLKITDFVDFHLKHNPTSSAYVFAYDKTHTVCITFQQLGRAVHRAASILSTRFPTAQGKVIGIIATIDTLLYQTITLGCIYGGFIPFLISPRNSTAAVERLLRHQAACGVLYNPKNLADGKLVESLTVDGLVKTAIPTLEETYGPDFGGLAPDFHLFPKSNYSHEIAFIIHSSGSTGFPKAVPQSFETVTNWMNFLRVSGTERPEIKLCAAMSIPSFHAFGINFQLLFPLTLVKPAALYPPTSFSFMTGQSSLRAMPFLPQPATVLQHVQLTGSDMLLTVPSLLTIWRSNPAHVDVLKTLKAVCCSSGPLPRAVGEDLIRAGVHLCTSYGATEFGIPTYRLPPGLDGKPSLEVFNDVIQRLRDWRYVTFNDFVKLRLIPTGAEGTFELQVLRCATHRPAVENLPDAIGYKTNDIVQAHPTRKGLWRVIGRVDDVIVLSTGEKVVPTPSEDILAASPLVSGVITFGRGRPHCGQLIEPSQPSFWVGREEELVDKLWPLIDQANASAPAFARITREMVLVTSFNKPLERVAKGAVARHASLKLYNEEIINIYSAYELGHTVNPPLSWETSEVLVWLRNQMRDLTLIRVEDVRLSQDIFETGFDSLSATMLRSRIVGVLSKEKSLKLSQNIVYDFPTLTSLSEYVSFLAKGLESPRVDREHSIRGMIEKYSNFATSHPTKEKLNEHVVLLIGSTGSLGSYVLEGLLRSRTSISKIYAVNRPSRTTTLHRQEASFRSKGLDVNLLKDERIVWLDGDMVEMTSSVKDEIDIIIHTAWRLDFNLSLASFEPFIRGIYNVINIARTARHHVRLVFISSTSDTQNWDAKFGPVPEVLDLGPAYALGKGYGESKYVSDILLGKSGIEFTCLRVGQISGGLPYGAWALSDWVPRMVKSSVDIGALPEALGAVSWIPMTTVAQLVLDVSFQRKSEPIINVVHPCPIQWNDMIGQVAYILDERGITQKVLPTIPFNEWVEILKRRRKASRNPLLSFFEHFASKDTAFRTATYGCSQIEAGGRARYITNKAEHISPAFRELLDAPIVRGDVDRWVTFWSESGLFDE